MKSIAAGATAFSLVASVAFFLPTVANAADPKVEIASAAGSCPNYTIGLKTFECHAAIIMHVIAVGRVNFTFGTTEYAVSFSGGSDSMSGDGTYTLIVDALINGQTKQKASGKCIARMTQDRKYLRTATCEAISKGVGVRVDFKSDGTPIEVSRE